MSEQIGFQHQNFRHFLICDFCDGKAISVGNYSKSNKLVAQIYHNACYLCICTSKFLSKSLLKDPWAKDEILAQST